MRIAILHRYPKECIKETNASIDYLINKIKKEGATVDVLTFKRFDRIGKWKFWKSLLWIFYAPMLVFGKGYDVIYIDDSYPFAPITVKLASPRSRVVLRLGDLHLMYYYSGLAYKILHFFEKIGWRMADVVLPISEVMQEYMMWECPLTSKVILDPVDPKDFPINGTKSHGTVMFHGVLTRNKNVDILLEAARRMPETIFVIIGDGPDRERLESLAPINVTFKKWVPFKSMHRYIATCAVGVALRSDNPGNEYVVTSPFLQYGIMGKPCLVTRRRVFEDYAWQFSDVDELVEKIKLAMEHPKAGEVLREYILEHHDAEKISEEIWNHLSA